MRMASDSINVSAPGSLMLLGEHAVLENHHAMACAVDRRIRVSLTPRADRIVQIHSELGCYEANLDRIRPEPPLSFVLEVIRRDAADLPGGFDLAIESEFSHTVGLGSSAAVTAAVAGALDAWRQRDLDPGALLPRCREAVWRIQGMGSGTDLAAALYGGIVLYRMDPLSVEPMPHTLPLQVVYSGHKEPTSRVVRQVQDRRREHPEAFDQIYLAIDWLVMEARLGIIARNLQVLGDLFNIHQGLMDAIGVNTPDLAAIVTALRNRPGITGAKISGSGLGDCVIGLGDAPPQPGEPGDPIDVAMDPEGIRREPA